MNWKQLDIVAFDTETTGLDPFVGERVVEVALVVFKLGPDGRPASREDHTWLVDPGIPIPRVVQQLTGLTDADVQGKPPFSVIAEEVASLLTGAVAVAHNLPFDHAFLTMEFERAGLPWREPLASVDTVDLSMRQFADARSHKLGDLSRRLDIRLTEAHRAANDAAACGLAFLELARRADVPDDLQALLDWANAIGRPPEDGPLDLDANGHPVFREGPHQGARVSDHPLHLAWMDKAKVLDASGWRWRYPESTRRWARRWLEVRAAGRATQNPKSFHSTDWTLDPCIADPRP
jgi:DNA polymerase-3 subunit epsilon